jgi:phosphate:Na+ symporter
MRLMSEGLQQIAGARLKRILAYMTTNRFAGVFSGFATTALIQSSSATTVMTVGFVDAGLLTLRQAIGVIMGANIGTTVTGWLVALLGFKFSVTSAALPAVAVGMVFLLVKRIQRDDIGETVLGFGLLFLGLGLLKDAVPDIRNNPEVLAFLSELTDLGFLSFAVFVLAGTLITIVVQSSSAAMAITLTMTFSGWIDFPTAAALILGENLGTTATAYLASLSAGMNARRAARAHTLFNAFGVLWIAVFFLPFLSLVDTVVPGTVTSRVEITAHLAMFHTMFNIANTGLCIGFVPYMERIVCRLVGETAEREPGEYRFPHVRTGLPETVELDVMAAQGEIGKMAELVEELFGYFLELFENPKK